MVSKLQRNVSPQSSVTQVCNLTCFAVLLLVAVTLHGCGEKCPEGGVPITGGKAIFKCKGETCELDKITCDKGYGFGFKTVDASKWQVLINAKDSCVIRFNKAPEACHKCDDKGVECQKGDADVTKASFTDGKTAKPIPSPPKETKKKQTQDGSESSSETQNETPKKTEKEQVQDESKSSSEKKNETPKETKEKQTQVKSESSSNSESNSTTQVKSDANSDSSDESSNDSDNDLVFSGEDQDDLSLSDANSDSVAKKDGQKQVQTNVESDAKSTTQVKSDAKSDSSDESSIGKIDPDTSNESSNKSVAKKDGQNEVQKQVESDANSDSSNEQDEPDINRGLLKMLTRPLWPTLSRPSMTARTWTRK